MVLNVEVLRQLLRICKHTDNIMDIGVAYSRLFRPLRRAVHAFFHRWRIFWGSQQPFYFFTERQPSELIKKLIIFVRTPIPYAFELTLAWAPRNIPARKRSPSACMVAILHVFIVLILSFNACPDCDWEVRSAKGVCRRFAFHPTPTSESATVGNWGVSEPTIFEVVRIYKLLFICSKPVCSGVQSSLDDNKLGLEK